MMAEMMLTSQPPMSVIHFLPDSLIRDWVVHTNNYINMRMKEAPHLKYWANEISQKVTSSDIIKFIGIFHYMP